MLSKVKVIRAKKSPKKSRKKAFSRVDLVRGLKDKKFKNISIITGAGVSTSAGIPDFRSPDTGIYSLIHDLGFSIPEDIFSLEFLQESPEPFFQIANRFLTIEAEPVLAHHFIKKCADEGMLLMNYTQNIDGLELKAGLPLRFLLQAHGHMRSAHCCKCHGKYDIEEFFEYTKKEQVFYCSSEKCDGIIKPDIVFFGEKLPNKYESQFNRIVKSDLVIVMGTSLKVKPFSGLLNLMPASTPLVLFNRENPGIERDNLLFLKGDIEKNLEKITKDCGWKNLKKEKSKKISAI